MPEEFAKLMIPTETVIVRTENHSGICRFSRKHFGPANELETIVGFMKPLTLKGSNLEWTCPSKQYRHFLLSC